MKNASVILCDKNTILTLTQPKFYDLQSQIQALKQFSRLLSSKSQHTPFKETAALAIQQNPWFTEASIAAALKAWEHALQPISIEKWLVNYQCTKTPKRIGLILAGNIPFVGLHDLLCVLVSGHKAVIKTASDDTPLMRWVISLLVEAHPAWGEQVEFTEKMTGIDAIIATGSNNSSRYFEYYFKNIPHIIRKNRNSVAVLTGNETEADLVALGQDVFDYFGLGCRNVSKVYLAAGFDPTSLLAAWEPYRANLLQHNRYFNNFEYHLALLMVNRVKHFTNNALILLESEHMASPVSMLHYQFYANTEVLEKEIAGQIDQIQCVLSANGQFMGSLPFGQSQQPQLWEYADGVDSLAFLTQKV